MLRDNCTMVNLELYPCALRANIDWEVGGRKSKR
jgi:hypothetical protein